MYQNYKNVEIVKPGGLELKDRLVGVQRVTKVTKADDSPLAVSPSLHRREIGGLNSPLVSEPQVERAR